MKIEIGQKVLMFRIRTKTFSDATVTKIARKYFWVDENDDAKFNIETGECATDRFVNRFKIYFSYEQWEKECEKEKEDYELMEISSRLQSKFRYYGKSPFTLDQLRRIEVITNESVK